MKNLVRIAMVSSVCFGTTVNAGITINSMINFADKNVSEFVVVNDDTERQFINVQVREVKVDEQGNLIKIPYTRENIDTWSVSSMPARGILEPNAKKAFRVKYEALPSHDENADKIYQVSFIPTPYRGEGESSDSSVKMAVGFSPYFIVPSNVDHPLSYDVKHNGKTISIHNKGKSYIHASFDTCGSSGQGESDSCHQKAFILSGRTVTIPLPASMQKDISVEFLTHHSKFEEKFELGVGKSKQS
ncbi:hypothetical protein ACPSL3_07650 [Vibrio owensii]|uniref:hypothetical protein n=1 Tax=Vibrio owensii TaxID=696485 RepID=UPI003CE46BD3